MITRMEPECLVLLEGAKAVIVLDSSFLPVNAESEAGLLPESQKWIAEGDIKVGVLSRFLRVLERVLTCSAHCQPNRVEALPGLGGIVVCLENLGKEL